MGASAVEDGVVQVGEAPAGGVRNADDGPPAAAATTAATQKEKNKQSKDGFDDRSSTLVFRKQPELAETIT